MQSKIEWKACHCDAVTLYVLRLQCTGHTGTVRSLCPVHLCYTAMQPGPRHRILFRLSAVSPNSIAARQVNRLVYCVLLQMLIKEAEASDPLSRRRMGSISPTLVMSDQAAIVAAKCTWMGPERRRQVLGRVQLVYCWLSDILCSLIEACSQLDTLSSAPCLQACHNKAFNEPAMKARLQTNTPSCRWKLYHPLQGCCIKPFSRVIVTCNNLQTSYL